MWGGRTWGSKPGLTGPCLMSAVSPPRADSTWLLLRRIRAQSGTRGLFAGFLPRIIKAAPSCAIVISTYELGKSFFQRLNLEQPLGP